MRDYDVDVVVLGAGIIGLSCACYLLRAGMRVAIVDRKINSKHNRVDWGVLQQTQSSVSALNQPSIRCLQELGLWERLHQHAAVTPFERMRLRTDLCDGEIDWQAAELGFVNLGVIVKNSALKISLWELLAEYPDTLKIVEGQPEEYDQQTNVLKFADKQIHASLLLACDGAASWARSSLGITIEQDDYNDQAWTGVLEHSLSHAMTVRQCFQKQAILGLLPSENAHQSVYVYSHAELDAPVESQRSPASMIADFYQQAFPELGEMHTVGELQQQPIFSMHAKQYSKGNVILLGDAAMALHPMAGLGLNCGLQGVRVVVKNLAHQYNTGKRVSAEEAAKAYTASCRGYNALTRQVLGQIRLQLPLQNGWASWSAFYLFKLAQHSSWFARRCIEHALLGAE